MVTPLISISTTNHDCVNKHHTFFFPRVKIKYANKSASRNLSLSWKKMATLGISLGDLFLSFEDFVI